MLNGGAEAGVAPLSVQPFKFAKFEKETIKHICLELFLLSPPLEQRIPFSDEGRGGRIKKIGTEREKRSIGAYSFLANSESIKIFLNKIKLSSSTSTSCESWL